MPIRRSSARVARTKPSPSGSHWNPSHLPPSPLLSPPVAAGKLTEEPRLPAHPPATVTATAAAAARLSPAPPLPLSRAVVAASSVLSRGVRRRPEPRR
jgi:hypothetical protein